MILLCVFSGFSVWRNNHKQHLFHCICSPRRCFKNQLGRSTYNPICILASELRCYLQRQKSKENFMKSSISIFCFRKTVSLSFPTSNMLSKWGSYFTEIIKLVMFLFLGGGKKIKISYAKTVSSETVTFKCLYGNVKAPFKLCAKGPKLDCLNEKGHPSKREGFWKKMRLPPLLVINLEKQISSG